MSVWQRFSIRQERDAELDEEIAAHLRMAAADRCRDGELEREAEAAARREFGNVGLVKEVTRDMWGWMSWERLWQDVRYTVRVLRKTPAFTAVAILSMALGIGANTAIFSLIDALLLRPLPVAHPAELMTVGNPARVSGFSNGAPRVDLFSYPFYELFRAKNTVFSDVYATGLSEHLNVVTSDGATNTGSVRGRFVTGNFFSMLGVGAALGRTFSASETQQEGSSPVIVISDGYWERQFGRSPSIIGHELTINGSKFTVIGVTPPSFFGDIVGTPIDIWFPITMQSAANPGRNYLKSRRDSWLLLMGRLKPGIAARAAESAVNITAGQIFRELYTGDETAEEMRQLLRQRIQVEPGGKGFSRLRSDSSLPLLILMGIVGVILLLCCANVANLQMARALNRGREMGLRLAVGAGQWRLIRQLLTESLLLSVAGGLLGLLFAYWASHLLLRLISPHGLTLHAELNAPVLLFTASVALLAGLLFGLAPAFRTAQIDLVASLKENKSGQQPDSFSQTFGRVLVISQIVLSVTLLVFAGLFLGTLRNLHNIDVGYTRQGLLLVEIDPQTGGYAKTQWKRLATDLLDRLLQIPGVAAASYSENGLFSGTSSVSDAQIEGYIPRGESDRTNDFDKVGPDYFKVVGTKLLAGRGILASDDERAAKVAVINEQMAHFYFPHSNPIGRHLFDGKAPDRVTYTIVGVAADAKERDLKKAPSRLFYLSLQQAPDVDSYLNFEIRTVGASERIEMSVRQTIAGFNRNLPITSLATADSLIDDYLSAERLIAELSGFFAALALLLGAIGLYGVLAYRTARRTPEIGIRLALGATRFEIIRQVLSETGRLVAVGLAIGIALATLLARLFEKSLFGLSAFDPATAIEAAAAISLAALIAAYLPARRAARVDPLLALRYE